MVRCAGLGAALAGVRGACHAGKAWRCEQLRCLARGLPSCDQMGLQGRWRCAEQAAAGLLPRWRAQGPSRARASARLCDQPASARPAHAGSAAAGRALCVRRRGACVRSRAARPARLLLLEGVRHDGLARPRVHRLRSGRAAESRRRRWWDGLSTCACGSAPAAPSPCAPRPPALVETPGPVQPRPCSSWP